MPKYYNDDNVETDESGNVLNAATTSSQQKYFDDAGNETDADGKPIHSWTDYAAAAGKGLAKGLLGISTGGASTLYDAYNGYNADKATELAESKPVQALAGEKGIGGSAMNLAGVAIRPIQSLAYDAVADEPRPETLTDNALTRAYKASDPVGASSQMTDALNPWTKGHNLPDWLYGDTAKTPPMDQVLDKYGVPSLEKMGDVVQTGFDTPQKDPSLLAKLARAQLAVATMGVSELLPNYNSDAALNRANQLGLLRRDEGLKRASRAFGTMGLSELARPFLPESQANDTDAHGTFSEYQHPPGWVPNGGYTDQRGNYHAGEESPNTPKPITMFDRNGDIKTFSAAGELGNFAMQQAAMAKVDPVMRLKFDLSPEGKAVQASRTADIYNQMLTADGAKMNPAEANTKALVPLSEHVAAGNAGIELPQFGPTEGLKTPGFLPIPAVLAPIFKPLAGMVDKLMYPISGENPRSPGSIYFDQAKNSMKAEVLNFSREQARPILNMLNDRGVQPQNQLVAGQLAQMFDPEAGGLRMPKGVDSGDVAIRAPWQTDIPENLKEQFASLEKSNPKAAQAARESFEQGANHFADQMKDSLQKLSAMPETEQAAVWEASQRLAELPAKQAAFMKSKGIDVPILNEDIIQRPKQILDAIDRLKEMHVGDGFDGQRMVSKTQDAQPGGWYTQKEGDYGNKTADIEARRQQFETEGPTKQYAEPKNESTSENSEFVAGKMAKGRAQRLSNLIDAAVKGPLNSSEMSELLDQLTANKEKNAITGKQQQQLQTALENQLPLAMKQRNAVATYQPGQVSEGAKATYRQNKNPLVQKTGSGVDPTKAEIGLKLSDLDESHTDMGNLKPSVWEREQAYKLGTAATDGEATAFRPQAGVWDKFLTQIGYKKFKEAYDQTFLENNAARAWVRKIENSDYKALTNNRMDQSVKNLYDMVPEDLTQQIKKATFDGIDTGRTAPTEPREFRNFKESLENTLDYIKEKEAFEKQQAEPQSVRRDATIEDLEKIWKDSGRKDSLSENIDPAVLSRVIEGKIPLKQAIWKGWQPAGRTKVTLDGDTGFIHSEVARKLEAYKTIGTDPYQFNRFMGSFAPVYQYALTQYKAWSTLRSSPISYILRKLIHDGVRMHIGDLVDGETTREILGGQLGHRGYANTGQVESFPTYKTEGGATIGGADAARELEQYGLMNGKGEAHNDFQKMDVSPMKSIENMVTGIDNSMRAASYYKLRRQGLAPLEASLRVNNAMFDFSNTGPLTKLASQMGVIPFATWHSKVIPFMVKWALQSPGEFMFVQRALQQLGAGQIAPSQLPEMLKNSTNLAVKKDKDGRLQIISDDGAIPGDEAMSLARSVINDAHNGNIPGATFLQGVSGAPLRVLYAVHDNLTKAAKDPNAETAEERTDKVMRALIGRPATIYKDITDPQKTLGDKVLGLVNPVRLTAVDMNKQGIASMKGAEANVHAAGKAVGNATKAVADAQQAVIDANKKLSQADVLKLSDLDPIVINKRQDLILAQQRLQNSKQTQVRVTGEYQRAQAFLDKFGGTK